MPRGRLPRLDLDADNPIALRLGGSDVLGIAGREGVDDLHPLNHLAEHGVLPVEDALVLVGISDEPLAAGTIDVGSAAGHAHGPSLVGNVAEFRGKRVAGTAGTGAGRVAGLRHDVWLIGS